jgi:hypothetical protein
MIEKEIHNKEAAKAKAEETKKKIGQANGLWAEEFHYQIFKILAPKGFKPKREDGAKVSNIRHLTEGRIKKVAVMAHETMKQFKQRFLLEMLENFTDISIRRSQVLEALNKELSYPFWKRHKKLIGALRFELLELEIQQKTLNGIEGILQTIMPAGSDIDDSFIEQGFDKLAEMQSKDVIPQGVMAKAIDEDKDNVIAMSHD